MITIFSKKAVTFNHPGDYSIEHTVKNDSFENVPDWVIDSTMFAALKSEGSVRIIESAKDLKVAEMSDTVKEEVFRDEMPEPAVETDEDENEEIPAGTDFASMKATELYKVCKEKGLEVEPKQSKDFYLEVLLEAERAEK